MKYQKVEPKGHFPNRFTGKNQFLFRESKLFYYDIQYLKEYPLESTSNHENLTFSVKSLITFTCRNSLINLVTNESYFGILIWVAIETYCESLMDQ